VIRAADNDHDHHKWSALFIVDRQARDAAALHQVLAATGRGRRRPGPPGPRRTIGHRPRNSS